MRDDIRTQRRNTAFRRAARRVGGCFVLAIAADPRAAVAQPPASGVPVTPTAPASPLPAPPLPNAVAPPVVRGGLTAPVPLNPAPNLPNLPTSPGIPEAAPVNAKVIETGPTMRVPSPPAAPAIAEPVPAAPAPPAFPPVVTVDAAPAPTGVAGGGVPVPRFIELRRDSTGLLPNAPPGPRAPRPVGQVIGDIDRLIERTQDPEAEIAVVVGHTKLLETRRTMTRIAVANPTVADVEVLADQPNSRTLNLYGRSFGNTTITFWDADNRPLTFLVRVTLDALDLESRIKQTFPGALIHVRQVGPQIILEGQVPDAKTMSEVLQLVSIELRNSGRSQVGGGGGSASAAATGARRAGRPAAAGRRRGLRGAGAAGAGAGAGLQFTIINRVHVPGPRQVMLRVKIAELNRTAIRQLGVSWLDPKNNAVLASTIGNAASIGATQSATQGAATGARGALSPIASTFSSGASATPNNAQLFGIFNAGQFSLFLNALRSNALAKILAEPNLMALDGQPARFLAGGLFPYPVPQSSSIPGGTAVVTVQFANFGAILSFLPHILANDEIQLDVEPVFSQLNFGAGTTINGGRVPAIDQRSARTVVRLREGQTLAIAGLLQTTTNASTTRIPVLGDLPIVGPLFSNSQIETVETELVVLVTPELVAPMEANEVPPAPGDLVFQPNDYEFYFLGRIEGKLGREFRATTAELDPLNVMKHFQSENHWVIGPHGHAD